MPGSGISILAPDLGLVGRGSFNDVKVSSRGSSTPSDSSLDRSDRAPDYSMIFIHNRFLLLWRWGPGLSKPRCHRPPLLPEKRREPYSKTFGGLGAIEQDDENGQHQHGGAAQTPGQHPRAEVLFPIDEPVSDAPYGHDTPEPA
jgi:hypothetical protein